MANHSHASRLFICLVFLLFASRPGANGQENHRQTLSLNGQWQLGETNSPDKLPVKYNRTCAVPGLIDMASPGFDTTWKRYLSDKVYWYRRKFSLSKYNNDVVLLKINKAQYHTIVYLNGKFVGENFYSFTPSIFDIKKFLHKDGSSNELIIGVGCKNNLPDTVTDGSDYEKIRYIPGIYDNVSIIQTGYPLISKVQIVPEVNDSSIRVAANITYGNVVNPGNLQYNIRELVSGILVCKGSVSIKAPLMDFKIKWPKAKLWSPEHPFLYTIELKTSADDQTTRFGIRSFGFEKGKQYALLNNKPYHLLGTNVTLYRFFEDPDRGNLPWNDKWVIGLHNGFKNMHWNSMRYCIGFPPERWYEIADSLGLLIQDEYPVWGLKPKITAEMLTREYTAWMEERWNHPSVAIWDGQNETQTAETGKAIQDVRHLDLSNRPWDNGYSPPQSETDPIESHPYLFVRYLGDLTPSSDGALYDMLSAKRLPMNDPNELSPDPGGRYYDNAVIINEYSWLWLNRDGSTTTLTDKPYKVMFGDSLTTGKRFELYARYVAMLTEYWRAHRVSAGVMHFCSLGYSRPNPPRGQTSDNFIDVKNLVYEPNFLKYVKPSFAPVGIMIDLWGKSYQIDETLTIPVYITNDSGEDFSNQLELDILKDGKVVDKKTIHVEVGSNGSVISQFRVKLPDVKGDYELNVFYLNGNEKVFSSRQFFLK